MRPARILASVLQALRARGGTPEKPVGLVYVAAAGETFTYVQKLVVTGRTREMVRLSSTQHALDMIRRLALDLAQPGCRALQPEPRQISPVTPR